MFWNTLRHFSCKTKHHLLNIHDWLITTFWLMVSIFVVKRTLKKEAKKTNCIMLNTIESSESYLEINMVRYRIVAIEYGKGSWNIPIINSIVRELTVLLNFKRKNFLVSSTTKRTFQQSIAFLATSLRSFCRYLTDRFYYRVGWEKTQKNNENVLPLKESFRNTNTINKFRQVNISFEFPNC